MSWDITDDYDSSGNLVSKIDLESGYEIDYGQYVEISELASFELDIDDLGSRYQAGDLIYIYQSRRDSDAHITSVSYTHDIWVNTRDLGDYIILILLHPLDEAGERKKVKRTNNKVSNIKPRKTFD